VRKPFVNRSGRLGPGVHADLVGLAVQDLMDQCDPRR
jgi:hypothetical protein